ncbi:MAG: MetQ/NlpA family ABC transporter substrate-binding protein [Bacilli bacterium]
MKKSHILLTVISCFLVALNLNSCGESSDKTIKVCASELPHANILNNVVKDLLSDEGYNLEVTILDWTIQNDAVKNGDYDANYFQHIPYLISSSTNTNQEEVFASCKVHYEPLRIYAGKASVDYKDSKATFEICNDVSNATRALDLLVDVGVLTSYEKDTDGNADLEKLPSNIVPIAENLLVNSLADYDYGLLPCNTAMTGNIDATSEKNKDLPSENSSLADAKANVIAASTTRYKNDTVYKAKIDVLTDALLTNEVKEYIDSTRKGVVLTYQKDLR